MTFDHIVIGLGVMGSATLAALSSRGQKVLGIEQFGVPNEMGSSHGLTRIIRLAYNEHPSYVPLLRRSYELWRQLQADAGEALLHVTGGLDIGRESSRVFSGSLQACLQHGLPHEVLDSSGLMARFGGCQVPGDFAAVYQPDAGFLRAERCVVAQVTQAKMNQAEVKLDERVTNWTLNEGVFRVETDRKTYEAPSLIITAGPWANKLVKSIGQNAIPLRQVVGWFEPDKPDCYLPENFPVFVLEAEEGEFYGFPSDALMPGFKIGRYFHQHEVVDPDLPGRDPDAADEQLLRTAVSRYFPHADGKALRLQRCLFTVTPDRHFILDQHPAYAGLTIGAGFSGHGFKFAPVVGEILSDLAINGSTQHDTGLFNLSRFDKRQGEA